MGKLKRWKLIENSMMGPYMLASGTGYWCKADEAEAALAERDDTIEELLADQNMSEEHIERLKARIVELESRVPKWVSVEDRLPGKCDYYRVMMTVGSISPKTEMRLCRFTLSGVPKFLEGDWEKVTHWMPLPTASGGE